MGGLDLPTSGEVWVGGLRIDQTSERARARLRRDHVGFVFQDFHLMEELTAVENVELPALLAGTASGRARRAATDLLEAVGLADRMRHRPAELSGGQKQRVAVARALVNRPTVLLADEPTGNLDSAATTEVLRLFDRLRAQGQTLVVVSHDRRAAATADRMVSMRDGALVDDVVLPSDVTTAAEILSASRE
jgi:putative ABC transport system ATP-binding protein